MAELLRPARGARSPSPTLRHVPWTLRLMLSVSGGGWLFLTGGIVFCAAFLPRTDLSFGYDAVADGRVVDVRQVSCGDVDVLYGVGYVYTVGGVERGGTSYTMHPPPMGSAVEVEHRASDPSMSRIVGMR